MSNFIAFEGGEGSGKSTQAEMLSQAFRNMGHEVVTTREPGGTAGAEAIRNLLLQGQEFAWRSSSELLLHMAARCDHVEKVIKPALEHGAWVISDRFAASSFVYQGIAQGLGVSYAKNLHTMLFGNFWPDLTLILDVPVKLAFERVGAREKLTSYEEMGESFHQDVRQGFLKLAQSDPLQYKVIDTIRDKNKVFEAVLEAVSKQFGVAFT